MNDIVLLTDFGVDDWYVGTMKGVIRAIAPEACLIDLTHEVEPGDIAQSDFILAQAAPYFREGTVFLVVVDPGVGSERCALACGDGKRFFIAPDNGVLSSVARDAGENWRAHMIDNPEWVAVHRSATFHGRDVFAPAAARLAIVQDIAQAGPRVDAPVIREAPTPRREAEGAWRGAVLHVDRFGNAITSFHRDRPPISDAGDNVRVSVELFGARLDSIAETYSVADSGEPLAYWGSSGYLEVAVNRGDAAEEYGISAGDPVLVTIREA